jgi:hypothetical protein
MHPRKRLYREQVIANRNIRIVAHLRQRGSYKVLTGARVLNRRSNELKRGFTCHQAMLLEAIFSYLV